MATEQQIQAMLDAMDKQMGQFTQLQEENARLRALVDQPGARQANHTKKPDRPTVESGMNDREWALFDDSWGRYKKMANITDLETIRMELRAGCSPDVNKMLFEFVGAETLDTCTEAELLVQDTRDTRMRDMICTTSMSVISSSPRSLMLE